MNVDRLPDGRDDDPERAAETPRLTESTGPETPPPPDNASRAEPSPEPEQGPSPDRSSPPERDQQPQTPKDVSTADGSEARESAEPRSRQEHADPPSPNRLPREANQEETPPDDGGTGEGSQALTAVEDKNRHAETDEVTPREEQSDRQRADEELPESAGPKEEGTKHSSVADPADQSTHPLTDQEHIEREADVFGRLTKAHDAELSTDYPHTTDPDRQQWTPQRDTIHGEIVKDIYERASGVPCEYKAIIVGGLGGAGKTTILTENVGIDLSRYLIVNPDDIKEEMARRGLVPEIEGLTPMEASDLVHEESSAVAKQLAHRAQLEGKNMIWDITMSSESSTQQRIDALRSAGYTQVDGIFVEISIETSIRRTQFRHREGHDKYRAGIGLGGRYIPPEVIRGQADPEWGCKNRKTFEKMKTNLNNWSIHDNSVDGRSAILIATGKIKDTGTAGQGRES